jgi:hypothetical protein
MAKMAEHEPVAGGEDRCDPRNGLANSHLVSYLDRSFDRIYRRLDDVVGSLARVEAHGEVTSDELAKHVEWHKANPSMAETATGVGKLLYNLQPIGVWVWRALLLSFVIGGAVYAHWDRLAVSDSATTAAQAAPMVQAPPALIDKSASEHRLLRPAR